jgi:hypothetical protein
MTERRQFAVPQSDRTPPAEAEAWRKASLAAYEARRAAKKG